MQHFIYETENLVNGKLYRGKHSTENIDDGYLGSGIAIQRAIKKYGKNNFKRIILNFCHSEERAYELEIKFIDEPWVKRKDTYNMVIGGLGMPSGKDHVLYGKSHSNEARKKMSEAKSGESHHMYGKTHSKESKQKMSKSHKGKIISKETKLNMSNAQKGEKNGHYGKKAFR